MTLNGRRRLAALVILVATGCVTQKGDPGASQGGSGGSGGGPGGDGGFLQIDDVWDAGDS